MIFARAYLRASTKEQDANRAKDELFEFARHHDLKIVATYIENESGASLQRPELFRLLRDCLPGDVLLVEQIDRLSRLNSDDWEKLKTEIQAKQIRVVSIDLPTSWMMIRKFEKDDIQSRILDAINSMMLDVLAAVARKDYDDRRRRQKQGIERAKEQGRYRGRPEDTERNEAIKQMLTRHLSWNSIQAATGCSRSTISRLAKSVQSFPDPYGKASLDGGSIEMIRALQKQLDEGSLEV